MNKRIFGLAIALLTVVLLFSACFVEYDPAAAGRHAAYGTYSGTVDGSAAGFGGTVTVRLTLKDGFITEAVVTGSSESPEYGGLAVAAAPKIIVAINSVELDTLSGASVTTRAITDAGKAALAKAGF